MRTRHAVGRSVFVLLGRLVHPCLIVLVSLGAQAAEPARVIAQPVSQSVIVGCSATFSAQFTGTMPIQLQWWRENTALIDETNTSLTVRDVTLSDNGARFRVSASNAIGDDISEEAVLVVLTDVVPPALLEAGGDATRTRVYLRFGGAACGGPKLERSSAEDRYNYMISDGLPVLSATLDASGTLVTLGTEPQMANKVYTVAVNNVQDVSGNLVRPDSTATFRSSTSRAEAVLFESFSRNPAFCEGPCPVFPCSTNGLVERFLSSFDTLGTRRAFDPVSYCARVSGYFLPPISGEWIFYLKSDHTARLYLGTNGTDPGSVWPVAEAGPCCHPVSANASSPVYLRAHEPVYLEAHCEEWGGDLMQVAARLATDPTPLDDLAPIPSEYLMPFLDATAGRITIQQQPGDLTVLLGRRASLEVRATVMSANPLAPFPFLHYQWQRKEAASTEWIDIPGATQAHSLTPPEERCTVLNPSRYRCRLYAAGAEAFTAEAQILVVADVLGPIVTRVEAAPNMTNVTVQFSEPISAETAGDLFNYEINGLPIESVTVMDWWTVRLRTSPQTPGEIYHLVLNRIHDLSDGSCGDGGEIRPNTTVAFQAMQRAKGVVVRETYLEIPGVDIHDLRTNSRFPDDPDQIDYVRELDGGTMSATLNLADNYGMRLSGFLCPSVSQAYDFYIASMGQGEFWLSTDETPTQLKLICAEPLWNEWRNWPGDGGAGPRSSRAAFPDGIHLTSGQCYYFEALMKAGFGQDHLAVTWTRSGEPVPAQGTTPIAGAHLASYARIVAIRPDGDFITLSWTLGGSLLSASSLSGPWTQVPSVTNSVTLPRPSGPTFFRAVNSR